MTQNSKDEKEKLSFRVFVTTAEAETGKRRPLTREETKYLRKSNWIRILHLFDYTSYLALLLVLVAVLSIMIGFFVSTSISSPVVSGLVGLGIPILSCSGFIILTWKRYPKGTKIWLSLKNLEAVELTGQLAIQIDPVEHSEKVFKLNNTNFVMPDHWRPYIYPLYKNQEVLPTLSIWTVKRKDASNKEFSYLYRIRNTAKYMSRFQDFQYQALSCGPLSVKQDEKEALPYVRENHFWLVLAMICTFIGIFASIFLQNQLENNNKAVGILATQITTLENELHLGKSIDAKLFSDRGLPLFAQDSTYGNEVLRNTTAFEYIDVSFGRNDRPFLLTIEEYKIIMRVSHVEPTVLLGYKGASSKTLADYRNAIIKVITKSTDLPETIRKKAMTNLLAMPDAVLEEQLRSYGDRFLPAPNFVSQFIPAPFIYMPVNGITYGRNCLRRDLFCLKADTAKPLDTKDMVIINRKDSQNQEDAGFEIIHARKLTDLAKRKQQFEAKRTIEPLAYWTQEKGLIGLLLFVVATLHFISFFQARRYIKKHYTKKFNL